MNFKPSLPDFLISIHVKDKARVFTHLNKAICTFLESV